MKTIIDDTRRADLLRLPLAAAAAADAAADALERLAT